MIVHKAADGKIPFSTLDSGDVFMDENGDIFISCRADYKFNCVRLTDGETCNLKQTAVVTKYGKAILNLD